MTTDSESYRYPYTPTPGASMPGPATTPEEGITDLRVFAWVTIVSVVIIAVAGIGAWLVVHH
jgi:hypothetical protein